MRRDVLCDCDECNNAADFLVDAIVSAEGDLDPTARDDIIRDNHRRMEMESLTVTGPDIQAASAGARQRSTFWQQIRMLTKRAVKNAVRNPVFTIVQLFQVDTLHVCRCTQCVAGVLHITVVGVNLLPDQQQPAQHPEPHRCCV